MKLDLHVQPTGKATAYSVLTQDQVQAIRGEGGRGRVNLVLRFEGHEFRTSISIYRGEWMFVVNKAMREAGLKPDVTYPVELVRDRVPKRAEPAADVIAALAKSPTVQAAWERLSVSRQREHLKQIEGAKRVETRERRIERLLHGLSEGANR